MRRLILASTAVALAIFCSRVAAQSEPELQKFELGVHFTSITKPDFGDAATEAGVGGRFTLNLNRSVAIEAEGNFFPHNCRRCRSDNAGTLAQGFFGVKAGKRFRKFGIFGKARPGFVSFSEGELNFTIVPLPPPEFPLVLSNTSRATSFAFDAGAVIELYHTRRIFTRFDGSDIIIRYPRRTFNSIGLDPVTGGLIPFPISLPSHTRHNFQFSAGIGFRF